MIQKLLHQIVPNPYVYDRVQQLVGAQRVRRQLMTHLQPTASDAVIVDLGGGTGNNRELFSPDQHYICLDNDQLKLKGFREKFPKASGLRADATCLPLQSSSVDLVLCTAVSHHIPDDLLDSFLSEAIRIIKSEGRFVFLDAVWSPRRLPSRLLWRYDRGSYPRTLEKLQATLARHGKILDWHTFAVYHRYVIAVVASTRVI